MASIQYPLGSSAIPHQTQLLNTVTGGASSVTVSQCHSDVFSGGKWSKRKEVEFHCFWGSFLDVVSGDAPKWMSTWMSSDTAETFPHISVRAAASLVLVRWSSFLIQPAEVGCALLTPSFHRQGNWGINRKRLAWFHTTSQWPGDGRGRVSNFTAEIDRTL